MNELEQEKKVLKHTVQEFEKALQKAKEKIGTIDTTYQNDEWIALEAKEDVKRRLHNLFINQQHPYFARIDFSETNQKTESFYIGKVGLSNEKDQIIVTDWRAPIASVYYDYTMGEASYQAPQGDIEGTLSLKRQYEIENQTLLSYRDVDTVSQDEILKPYLDASADNRLKSIVASIQGEQNAIIRKTIRENIIVQGVAGSGKTTVALHRIAYLVYQHKDTIYSRDFMVIGPNAFFVNYISSVLPDLDVYDVSQNDFLSFTQKYLKQKYKLVSGDTSYAPYKTSLACMHDLKEYMIKREEAYMRNHPFCLLGIPILSGDFIWETYLEIQKKTKKTASIRLERLLLFLTKYIQNQQVEILSLLQSQYYQDLEVKSTETLKKEKKELDCLTKEIAKGFLSRLRKHFAGFIEKPQLIYASFLEEKKGISKEETKQIRKQMYHVEDLPALLFIKFQNEGSGYYENYKHVVLDEAQDYNDFHFWILKKIFSKATFSIFGDLAQSLYPNHSIQTWDSLLEHSFLEKTKVLYLQKSYRTTIEIMNEANKINQYLSLPEAVPVIRHGQEVTYTQTQDFLPTIIELLQTLKAKYDSIAIIHKDEKEVYKMYNKLKKEGFSISYIHEKESTYTGGICIVTSALSKGLEFDAVIIWDVDASYFSLENSLDMKQLYVSMTRALHILHLLYKTTLPSIFIDKKKR